MTKVKNRIQYVHIMRGLPGCGKSTESRNIQLRNKRGLKVFRVNLSSLRKMFYPDNEWSTDFEAIVSNQQRILIMSLLEKGFDVIVDNTNLGDITWLQSLRFCSFAKVKVLVYDRRDTKLDLVLERNQQRLGTDSYCQPEVIIKLARQQGLLK